MSVKRREGSEKNTRKRGSEKSEKWKEGCRRHKNGSDEYHDRVRTKFDQESALANGVEEFERQATRRVNETVRAAKRHMVWWRDSWWMRNEYGPHLKQQGADDERGVQPLT